MVTTPSEDESPRRLTEEKEALRQLHKERRKHLSPSARDDASQRIAAAVVARLGASPQACVAAYWPLPHELDPRPCFGPLLAQGHTLALPIVEGRGLPLRFRAWSPEVPLEAATFGTRIPPATQPLSVPGILLVPLLAFDRRGKRLGYGGGYYDRTLAQLRKAGPTLAIGLSFAALECQQVPTGASDQSLDEIITEDEHIVVTTS